MTVVEIVNMALLHLGVSQSIADIDESTREAATAKIVYDHTLRLALRRFPWSFATKYATLYQTAGPFWNTDPTLHTYVQAWDATYAYNVGDVVRVANVNYYCILAHTNHTAPNATYWSTSAASAPDFANGDWLYTYRQPTDCVYGRRIVPPGGDGRQHNDEPIRFRRFRDENGLLFATNQQEAVLEYTMVDCLDMWTDDLFLQYLTWALAGKLVPSLERAQKSVIECHQMAELAYRVAATADLNEAQLPTPAEASWIRAR